MEVLELHDAGTEVRRTLRELEAMADMADQCNVPVL
jgi:hypothetical protein